jgi:hypothetical protein
LNVINSQRNGKYATFVTAFLLYIHVPQHPFLTEPAVCLKNIKYNQGSIFGRIMELADQVNPLKRPRKNKDVKLEGARSKLSGLRDKSTKPQTSSANDLRIIPLVALSEYDKASQLLLCQDQLICTGCEVSVVFTSESVQC